MNLNLKAVYFCCTDQHKWGKGLTIAAAKKAAGVEKKAKFYVMAACLMNPTDEQLPLILACITGNSIDGQPEYYKDDRTPEDSKLISELHVGWLTVENNLSVS